MVYPDVSGMDVYTVRKTPDRVENGKEQRRTGKDCRRRKKEETE